ncbi:MAG: uncharacterized protein K0Q74_999 [Gammaproteobacteria bacterium]|jgi:hypothetical protein|nr:uncharacterized protein [Gammaproteobacteria bacterium]
MKDFLLFKRMLIPYLVQVVFWLGFLACLLTGGVDLSKGFILRGIGTMIVGPILVRMLCEYVVVLFRINDTLTEIRLSMRERSSK